MQNTREKLVAWLFQTNAIKVCPQDRPFWYTSGTIGPYYINTHYLYGNEEKAGRLLGLIDILKSDKVLCPVKVLEETERNYNEDDIYRGLIDEMVECIKNNMDINMIDIISGGERRDWFFSPLISKILKKPHLTIYKDLDAVLFSGKEQMDIQYVKGKNILHIADLITEASSYLRAWIPAVKNMGGFLKWSLVVVDRLQGGAESLALEGVESMSLINVEKDLFTRALEMNLISQPQYELVIEFLKEPRDSMRRFLLNHPEYIKESLEADEKTRERAKLCLEKNTYSL